MYREKISYENFGRAQFVGVGEYGIPPLWPVRCEAERFIGFNYAGSCKEPEKNGVHFFVDDYQFTRLWSRPDDYLRMLGRFQAVCTPDFSTYTDYPMALQIYNHYRKHWLGAYWQEYGIQVIPTISWSDERSFEWCFDGEPVGGDVAVSSVGTQACPESRRLFLLGYREMLDRLQPERVLFCGKVPEGCEGTIIRLPAFQEKFEKRRCAESVDDV